MRNAIIYLTTPLFNDPAENIPPGAYKLRGEILAYEAAGLRLKVAAFGNDREWFDVDPAVELFLPAHKIDFGKAV
jgi:hypothetical protein